MKPEKNFFREIQLKDCEISMGSDCEVREVAAENPNKYQISLTNARNLNPLLRVFTATVTQFTQQLFKSIEQRAQKSRNQKQNPIQKRTRL